MPLSKEGKWNLTGSWNGLVGQTRILCKYTAKYESTKNKKEA